MRTYIVCVLLAALIVGMAATGSTADVVVINNYGITPFVYGGFSYIPLRSATDFLGAGLLWDSVRNRAVIAYRGHELGLVVGSTTCYYDSRPVVLPAAPIVYDDYLMAPAVIFPRYFDVPVRWEDHHRHRVLLEGPPGWGYYTVDPYTPAPALAVFESYPAVFVGGPFIAFGVTYVPLRTVAEFIGALLLFDALEDSCVVAYGGEQFVFACGSPALLVGTRTVFLDSPPLIVRDSVYVPEEFFTRYARVPFERRGGAIRVRGASGWHEMNLVASPPPRWVASGPPAQARFAQLVQRGVAPARAATQAAALAPKLVAPRHARLMAAAPTAKARRAGRAAGAAPRGRAARTPAVAAAPRGKARAAAAPKGKAARTAAAPRGKARRAAAVAAAPRGRAPRAAAAAAPKGRAGRPGHAVAAAPTRKAAPPGRAARAAAAPRGKGPGAGRKAPAAQAPRGGAFERRGAAQRAMPAPSAQRRAQQARPSPRAQYSPQRGVGPQGRASYQGRGAGGGQSKGQAFQRGPAGGGKSGGGASPQGGGRGGGQGRGAPGAKGQKGDQG